MDFKDIEKAAKEQGWTVGRTQKNERLLVSPSGERVTLSGTPGDQRSIINGLSKLKSAGLIWPWTARDRRKARKELREKEDES